MSGGQRGLVLVTGANGFIGRHVVRALHDGGWRVRGTVRSATEPMAAGVERAVVPDVCDGPAVAAALRGVTHVVHLAARAHVRGSRDAAEFRRVNLDGTRVLAERAVQADVSSIIFVSSAAAASRGVELLSDTSRGRPDGPYGESKLAAEGMVRAIASSGGIPSPVLRPAMVYGPGMKGNPLLLFQLVRRGLPLPFGGVENRRSALFSGNLAATIAAVLEDPAAVDTVWHIADTEAVSTPRLIEMIAAALGTTPRLVRVPPTVLRLAAAAAGVVTAGRFGRDALEKLTSTLIIEDGTMRDRLGFRSPYDLASSLNATAAAYLGRPLHSNSSEPSEHRVPV